MNETRFDPKKVVPNISWPKRSRPYFDALDEREIGISFSDSRAFMAVLVSCYQQLSTILLALLCVRLFRKRSPQSFGGTRVANLFSVLCCPIMCLNVLSSVL